MQYERRARMTRRDALKRVGSGFGMVGLAGMLGAEQAQAALAAKAPHFPARAKRVIFLFMHGGPSSIDTFDPKPYLDAHNGEPLPIK